MEEEYLVDDKKLKTFVTNVFTKIGVPETDARVTADVIVRADLRGIESHGVARIHRYTDRILSGLIKVKANIRVMGETPTALLIDGDNGLGQVVSVYAMKRCLTKAKESGVCIATVRNSNHFGIAGYYAMLALKEDMIGVSLTNARALVAPTYGRKAMLGTNPIAVAVPTASENPFVLDMATSVSSIGKIEVYERREKKVPPGWGINSHGKDTFNPTAILRGGALLPLGGHAETAGYKGYGLAVVIDILCGVLSGAAFGSHVGPLSSNYPSNTGHFFAAIDISPFLSVENFREGVSTLLKEIKASAKAEGHNRIYASGEIEAENEKKRRERGIPMHWKVYYMLSKMGDELGLEMDIMRETSLEKM